jgi:hypothetical protein
MYVYQYDIKPNYPGDTIILPGNPLLGQPPPTLGF